MFGLEQVTHDDTTESTSLTPRQLATLPYLIASPSVSEAAALAKIGRKTLCRWMADPEFRHKLERMRAEAADLARTELNGLMLKGIVVLANAMDDPDPVIRLRAARDTVNLALKAIDVKEMREAIDRVDDALHLWASRNPIR